MLIGRNRVFYVFSEISLNVTEHNASMLPHVRYHDWSVKIFGARHCTRPLCEKSDSYVVGCWSNEVQIKWSFAIRHAASRIWWGVIGRALCSFCPRNGDELFINEAFFNIMIHWKDDLRNNFVDSHKCAKLLCVTGIFVIPETWTRWKYLVKIFKKNPKQINEQFVTTEQKNRSRLVLVVDTRRFISLIKFNNRIGQKVRNTIHFF